VICLSERINISFKETKLDQKLLQYLKQQSELIGPSAYMKQLLYNDMLKNLSNETKSE
jgi:hypothetical protein